VIGLKRRNIQTKTGGKFCERLGETREICWKYHAVRQWIASSP
jgi:hypothetical protein